MKASKLESGLHGQELVFMEDPSYHAVALFKLNTAVCLILHENKPSWFYCSSSITSDGFYPIPHIKKTVKVAITSR